MPDYPERLQTLLDVFAGVTDMSKFNPWVCYAYFKQLWAEGDRQGAYDQLKRFIIRDLRHHGFEFSRELDLGFYEVELRHRFNRDFDCE